MRVVVALCIIFFCGLVAAQLSSDEQAELLAYHNQMRDEASPTPNNVLNHLTWDDGIAAEAQAFASQCKRTASQKRLSTAYGEVILFGFQYTMTDVYNLISAQAPNYDFVDAACKKGSCKYWTQVVNADTTTFGCGASDCGVTMGRLLVCNYKTFGQYNGVNPYEPAPNAQVTGFNWNSNSGSNSGSNTGSSSTGKATNAPTTRAPTTRAPTAAPSNAPTNPPSGTTRAPTASPTSGGTTRAPTAAPTTKAPTAAPTTAPSNTDDYRGTPMVTKIKNQGQCGSCWAFATTAAIEGAIAKKYGSVQQLSEQQVLECTPSGSCDGGWPSTAMKETLSGQGGNVVTMDTYAYTAKDAGTAGCKYDSANTGGKMVTYGTTAGDKATILAALRKYGPMTVAVYADSAWNNYGSGMLAMSGVTKSQINHAVTLVGYDAAQGTQGAWIIRNSWGGSWGKNGGYCYVDIANDYGISLYGATWAQA